MSPLSPKKTVGWPCTYHPPWDGRNREMSVWPSPLKSATAAAAPPPPPATCTVDIALGPEAWPSDGVTVQRTSDPGPAVPLGMASLRAAEVMSRTLAPLTDHW